MQHFVSRRSVRLASVTLLVALTPLSSGCFHPSRPGVMADKSLITEAEIDSAHAGSALETIARLRPMFLISRGKMTFDPKAPPALPNVYVDEMFYGDATTLRAISASTIETIKFYNAAEAQLHYGRGNMAGVIAIVTKHRPPRAPLA